MISFNSFRRLTEASSGAVKWKKYFADGEVATFIKKDVNAKGIDGTPDALLPRLTKVIVPATTEYSSTIVVATETGGMYSVPFTVVDKPIHTAKVIKFDLKPDKLGIIGTIKLSSLSARIKSSVDQHPEIPDGIKAYLKSLVDSAVFSKTAKVKQAAASAFVEAGIDQATLNSVARDFTELLGPFYVSQNDPTRFRGGSVFFPEKGNEALYDFKMIDVRGEPVLFSSKVGGGHSNTLKVDSVLRAVDADPKLQAQFPREVEMMKIIQTNRAWDAPVKLAAALGVSADPKDKAEIVELEKAVVAKMNTTMNFLPLVKAAIPSMWVVKTTMANDGTIRNVSLTKGDELSNVYFRPKGSSGLARGGTPRISDKLGFQLKS